MTDHKLKSHPVFFTVRCWLYYPKWSW